MEKVNLVPSSSLQYLNTDQVRKVKPKESFQTFLTDALQEVDVAQKEARDMTNMLILGGVEDLHQVTIAAQKASITLDLTVQVRNKVIEAYQEIMRMQM